MAGLKYMKQTEITTEIQRERFEYINSRWRQLYELEKETGLAALQYLFLTNAGGAATTLAFIGTVHADKIHVGAKVALAFYVVGIILSGVSRAQQFHRMSMLFRHWKYLVDEYFKGSLDYQHILEADKSKSGYDKPGIVIGYCSFGCFIVGSTIGFIAII